MSAPARGYSWPPLELGNTLSVRHGAHSPRLADERARRILDELSAEPPAWLESCDRAALAAWATAEARTELLREWLSKRAPLRRDGKPWPAEDLLLRWERRAADARARLGFDPASRARIRRDNVTGAAIAAAGLDAVRAAGRATREEEVTDDS